MDSSRQAPDPAGSAQRMNDTERRDRADRMYAFYQGPPERTLEQVGEEFGGLTKERVRQIFVSYGFEVRFPRPWREKPSDRHTDE